MPCERLSPHRVPEDGTRYEIIDGELYMSKQPHTNHQDVCGEIFGELRDWNKQNQLGRAYFAPGIIFAEDDDVGFMNKVSLILNPPVHKPKPETKEQ